MRAELRLKWAIRPAADFDAFAQAWDSINRTSGALPFLESDFIRPSLAEFGSRSESVVIGSRAGTPSAAAIVTRTRPGIWQTFQPSQLPLGALVCGADLNIETIAADLLQALPGLRLQLGLTQLDPRTSARPPDSACLQSLDYIETAWIDVKDSFDSYWAVRGKNLRQNMAKQRRRLQADGVTAALDVLTAPAEVAAGLRDYCVLESAGWKSEGSTAIVLNTPQGRFFSAMLDAFARRGAARVYRYRFDDRPVAVDLCIEAGPVQVVLKTTYDESIKSLSPAFLMRQDVLAHEWETRRLRRIEFYGRRMEWHLRWTDQMRVLYHLNVYRWPLLRRLHQRMLSGLPIAAREPFEGDS